MKLQARMERRLKFRFRTQEKTINYNYDIEINYNMYNPVFIPYLEDPRTTEIFFGGSSSGKSNFVASRAVEEVLTGGHNYLCLRKMGNSITKSVFNELSKAIKKFKVTDLFNIVPSQGHITCVNGYQFLFSGLDDVEKIKSITPAKGVLTDVWIEEATEIARADLKQLKKRLRGRAIYAGRRIKKRVIMTFNPIFRTHWIVNEYFRSWKDDQKTFENDKIRILKTTHLDNQFLDDDDHYELENEEDPYWYEVYTLGNWGTLGDTILKNWTVEDLSTMHNEFTNIRLGLDFGYSADPAALVCCHYDKSKKKIYIFDGFSAHGLTNPALADRMKSYVGDNAVFCDSAEPKSIKELQDCGITAKAVKKGKDSVLFGIQWLQQHEIIVDSALQGVINELTTWEWKKDKDGNSLPIPSGENNHFIDALRYAHEIEYLGLKGLDLR